LITARALPYWITAAVVIAAAVIMLLWPIDAVQEWQGNL